MLSETCDLGCLVFLSLGCLVFVGLTLLRLMVHDPYLANFHFSELCALGFRIGFV